MIIANAYLLELIAPIITCHEGRFYTRHTGHASRSAKSASFSYILDI